MSASKGQNIVYNIVSFVLRCFKAENLCIELFRPGVFRDSVVSVSIYP